MSFTLIKSLLFPRGKRSKQPRYDQLDTHDGSWATSSSPSSSVAHGVGGSDVESQYLMREMSEKLPIVKDSADKKFKIDARVISDAIIGLSDGLTVPFALTASLSAIGNTKVVVYGGMAELIAGAISMGLGGYLGAKSEEDSYKATLAETAALIANSPAAVDETISDIFSSYDVPQPVIKGLTDHLSTSPHLLDFMMRFEHTLPEPTSSRAITCALTIALGYFIGGFVPLLPYMLVPEDAVNLGLYWSISIMVVTLFAFGYVKTGFVAGWHGWKRISMSIRGGLEMVVVGGVAAGAAMALVVAFQNHSKIDEGVI